MKPFVLIGAGQFAEYVRYILEHELNEKVVAFAVNERYLNPEYNEKDGIPIVPYEAIRELYSPMDYCVAISFLGNDMFLSREKAFVECMKSGYQLPNIIHPSVINQTVAMGQGNIIGAGTILGPFTEIGCMNVLFDHSFTAHNVVLGDCNLLTANVSPMGNCKIGNHCFVGAGSVINNRVVLADYTLVGAGAFVRRSTKTFDVIVPARSYKLEKVKSTDFGI